MGPRARTEGREISPAHRDSISGPPSPYRVAILTTLSRPKSLSEHRGKFAFSLLSSWVETCVLHDTKEVNPVNL